MTPLPAELKKSITANTNPFNVAFVGFEDCPPPPAAASGPLSIGVGEPNNPPELVTDVARVVDAPPTDQSAEEQSPPSPVGIINGSSIVD